MTASSPAPSNAQPMNMVLGQIITNEVLDPGILNALASTPRDCFVPAALAGAAYADAQAALGNGRFLIAPLEFARMLQLAQIRPGHAVLVVGAGMGYSLAVLGKLAREVVGVEVEDAFITHARAALSALGAANTRMEKVSALADGYGAAAPYDAILIEGAVENVGDALKKQLANGGRLVTVERMVATPLVQGMGRMVEYVNIDGTLFRKETTDAALPLLPGFSTQPSFVL